MSATLKHYVCDRCGNHWRAYRSTKCPACKHTALWEFEREQAAAEHAARILNPHESVKPL